MPSTKLDYLSKYYSSAGNNEENDKKKSKKDKKKKDKKKKSKHSSKDSGGGGGLIVDEDNEWNGVMVKREDDMDEDNEEDRPTIVDDLPEDFVSGQEGSKSSISNKPRGSWEVVSGPDGVDNGRTGIGDGVKEEASPSPPRRRRRYDSDNDGDSDKDDNDREKKSRQRQRHDSSSDEDAKGSRGAQKRSGVKEESPSPESNQRRRQRHDSDDDDDGPPGNRGRRSRSPSPEERNLAARRRQRRHDSDDSSSDDDGRRRRRHHSKDSDDRAETDRIPIKRHDSSSEDDSKGRNGHVGSRKRRYDSDGSARSSEDSSGRRKQSSRRRRYDSDEDDKRKGGKDDSKKEKEYMASGHVAGLQKSHEFTKAEEKIQLDKKRDAQHMVDKYGMGDTTYRDEKGRRVDPAELAAKKKKFEIDPELDRQLNTGKVQRDAQRAQQEEYQILSQSAFARHADDDRLEAMKKAEIRKDDPMAAYAARKEMQERQQAGLVSSRPVYKGPPPRPHRFGNSIRPGYRWDGVYRGNGFEDKLLASQFSTKQKAEDAYKWSSADM